MLIHHRLRFDLFPPSPFLVCPPDTAPGGSVILVGLARLIHASSRLGSLSFLVQPEVTLM